MVLSNKPFSSAEAAREYYSHGDYYGSEGQGLWLGGGTKELGFKGEFSAKSDQAFNNILKGILPNGQVLGKRTKDGIKHRPGLDLTFSCPKSFSIQMLLYADKEEKEVLQEAMMSAVCKTLGYIEKQGYVVSRKAHGVIEKLDRLTFAAFNHTTNRNLEPQIHVHCLLANVAKCKDGRFRSITYDQVFENTKFLGQIFRNELAFNIKRLGYEVNAKTLSDGSSSFELANIDPKLIKAFSTRRQEIEDLCKLYGIVTKKGRDKIVITSRKSKKSVKLEDIVKTWKVVESNVIKENGNLPVFTKPNLINLHINNQRTRNGYIDNLDIRVEQQVANINDQPTESIQEKSFYIRQDKVEINQIYRVLYDKLPSVLSEFGFVKKGNCYISTTGQKVDGSLGKKGKIYVYENNPGVLVDYTRGSKSVWDYIRERYMPGASNGVIFQYLTSITGLKSDFKGKLELPPSINIIQEVQTTEPETKQVVEKKTWELVYKFALEKIEHKNNEVSKYLETRGYSKEVINKMGIGYIPSKKGLLNYLSISDVSQANIIDVKKTLGYIGSTHKMVIPYYDNKGDIIGFAARDIKYTKESRLGKYMYTKGLIRNSTLLGIHKATNAKELIIVEGMLDYLHANAKGINNVVALGGTGFNYKQVELINKIGIEKLTICLDNDKAGQEATDKLVNFMHDKYERIQIKVATLPEGIKDFDELLKVKGAGGAHDVIVKAELKEKEIHQESKLSESSIVQEQPLINKELKTDTGSEQMSFMVDNSGLTISDLVRLCVEGVTHHKTVFSQEELSKKIMRYSIGSFSIGEIQKEIRNFEKSGALIRVGENITTRELLTKEKQILQYAQKSLDQGKQIINNKHFQSRCIQFEKRERVKNPKFQINDQQKKALKHILTSQDNIIVIEGLPGVGKSTVLNAVRDISNRKIMSLIGLGEKFQGVAPTASASKTLYESAKVESRTLHSLLSQYQGYIEDRGTQESLWALKQKFRKVIMFLDESSLVSTKMMWKLLKLQDKFGFRLVVAGDTTQLNSVEAGKPFEQMLKILPSVKLTQIVRQKDDKHQEAVIASSKGDISKTFEIHNDNIREEPDPKVLAQQAVGLYLQKDPKQRDNTLLISPTRKLRDQINNKIRVELKKEGVLQGGVEKFQALRQKDMTISDYKFAVSFNNGDIIKFNTSYKKNGIEKGDYFTVIKANTITNALTLEKGRKQVYYHLKKDVNYENKFEVFREIGLKLQTGLKIRFTKNLKELGLINSETAVIQKIGKNDISLKLEDNNIKNIPKDQLKHIDYGYCITIYSAQGKTFDSTIAAISNNKWLNNQKSWLVTLSRHKSEFTALVQNKSKLESYLMKNKGNELSAIELISQSKIAKNEGNLLQQSSNKSNIKKEMQIEN